MTQIYINCTDQVLNATARPHIASGGVNEDRIQFTFCDLWAGYIKTAVFYREEDEVYHVLLDENDTSIIPHEVLKDPGVLHVGVFGIKDNVTRTSFMLRYLVGEGAITEATAVSDPTPDIYAQIMSRLNDLGGGTGECPADVERMSNRVVTINDASDDEHYPTAKAVYDAVNGVVVHGDIEDDIPEGCKIQIITSDTHSGKTVSIDGILSAPIYGTVSEDKVVTLNGNLDPGVYEFKIVRADGSTADLCTYEVV